MLSQNRHSLEEAESFFTNSSHVANWYPGCHKEDIISETSILLNSINTEKRGFPW